MFSLYCRRKSLENMTPSPSWIVTCTSTYQYGFVFCSRISRRSSINHHLLFTGCCGSHYGPLLFFLRWVVSVSVNEMIRMISCLEGKFNNDNHTPTAGFVRLVFEQIVTTIRPVT
mmetsp:Transcript_23552/g.55810  ORF Transcript_23552/g.55810 Transcript_23552/m.55810 type:complete len:115 (+) Transcript_23552:391-735(+)